jgi:hypothetical protein
MLRILVISLFVANLLLFGFQRKQPDTRPETTVAPAVKKNTGIPTIHLFSEMMQDQELLTGNRQCFSLGPFHSTDDKDEVLLLLQEISTGVSERQTEALVEKGYWVFMPPYGSLLEANQALISLQALGLEDIGIIYDGEWKNAISLGYFMRQENAQRRKKSVESRGYAPMIRVQRQGEPRYWLDYEQPPGSGLVALDMQNRPNDFMQRSMPCPKEDAVEFNVSTREEPVQVIAQLQEPGVDNQEVAGEGQEAGEGDGIEEVVQEGVADLPDPAVETLAQEVADTGTGDIVETEQGDAVDTSPGDAIDTEPENVVETGSEDAIGTEPGNAAETGSEDAIETGPGNTIETGSEGAAEITAEEIIDSGLENTIEPATTDPVETNSNNAVGTGPPDGIDTEPEEDSETGTGGG